MAAPTMSRRRLLGVGVLGGVLGGTGVGSPALALKAMASSARAGGYGS